MCRPLLAYAMLAGLERPLDVTRFSPRDMKFAGKHALPSSLSCSVCCLRLAAPDADNYSSMRACLGVIPPGPSA